MEQVLSQLKAAGELTRLRLLCLLAKGELNVTEITQILGQSQPRISRHLKLLSEAGLIERYREGSFVYFRLSDGAGGDIARQIISFVPAEDHEFIKDGARYEQVREKSAAVADAYFTKNASQWDDIRALHVDERDVEQEITRLIGSRKFNTLVDLGTGTGRILELLADQYDAGIGIDANTHMLGYARARLEKLGHGHAQLRQGDILNLSADKETADAVVLHQVLHYLDEPMLALEEAARICRDKALVLIVDFATHDLEFLREQYAHKRLGFSDEKITEWAKKLGFKIIESRRLKKDKNDKKQDLVVCLWLLEKI